MPYPGTLTKAHIIDAVAERNGFTRKKSIETVEILLELIKQSLESGDDVLKIQDIMSRFPLFPNLSLTQFKMSIQ
jgi:hypothetical protein